MMDWMLGGPLSRVSFVSVRRNRREIPSRGCNLTQVVPLMAEITMGKDPAARSQFDERGSNRLTITATLLGSSLWLSASHVVQDFGNNRDFCQVVQSADEAEEFCVHDKPAR